MNKIKTITIILLLIFSLVFAGCSGPVARHSNDDMSQHDCDEKIDQLPWNETGSIDIDWPF
jgi:hypothetical protein